MLNLKLTMIMELYELKDSREFRAAKQLEEALNDYGFDYKKFTEAIPHMHPTLQQNSQNYGVLIFISHHEQVSTSLSCSVPQTYTLKAHLPATPGTQHVIPRH